MTDKPALIGAVAGEAGLACLSFNAAGDVIARRLSAVMADSAAAVRDAARQMAGVDDPSVPVLASGALSFQPGGPRVMIALTAAPEEWVQASADVPGIRIVASLRQDAPPDVLTYETAILAGLGDPGGRVCIPGPITRHVRLREGGVASFASEMTFELRGLLMKAGTLKSPDVVQEDNAQAFAHWLERGLETGWRGNLYSLAAARDIGLLDPAHHVSALTGLLTGADISAHYEPGDEVILAADGPIGEAYGRAFDALGADVEEVSAEEALENGLFDMADAAGMIE